VPKKLIQNNYFVLILFIIISFLLYGNTLKGGFVYDDAFFTTNQDLRNGSYLDDIWREPMLLNAGLYRPLVTSSFSLNYILFGDNPLSFRLFNVFLNGLNAFLIYFLVATLFKDRLLGFITALIYSSLPIHTEVVANIKSRDELLSAFFMLTSWILFVKAIYDDGKKTEWRLIILSSVLYLLAVFSKELVVFGVVTPFILSLVKGKTELRTLAKIAFVFLPSIVFYLALRFQILGIYASGSDDIHFISNPLKVESYAVTFFTGFKIFFNYVAKIIVPVELSATYHYNHFGLVKSLSDSWESMFGFAILFVSVGVLIVSERVRRSAVGIGLIFFVANYLVFSQFLFRAGDIFAERWMYLPSLGVSLIIGYLFCRLFTSDKTAALVILTGVLVSYSVITIQRNKIWLSEEALAKSMVRDAPNSVQGHYFLAKVSYNSGNLDAARTQLEMADKIYSFHPPSINLLAAISYEEGDYLEAERLYLKSLKIDPWLANTNLSLGGLYYATGRYDKALPYFKANVEYADRVGKDEVVFYAATLTKLGRYEESKILLSELIENGRNSGKIKTIQAYNYFKTGNIGKAKELLETPTITGEALEGLITAF